MTRWIRSNPHYTWGLFLTNFFNCKFYVKFDSKLDESNETYYLLNHLSQADFFIDQIVTKGRSIFISRWLVGLFAPNILFYPEGKRNPDNKNIPLKFGLLKNIYQNKKKVQIIICSNKEKVFSFIKRQANFNVDVDIVYSKTIKSSDFNSFEVFYHYVSEIWLQTKHKCYNETTSDRKQLDLNNYYKVNIPYLNLVLFYLISLILVFIYIALFYILVYITIMTI